MDIPVIESERLVLRPFELQDFEPFASYWADTVVSRWTKGGRPKSRTEAWAMFLKHPGHWMMRGFGMWAVEEKASGTMIGEVGFIDLKRDYDPMVNDVPEIGWVLAPAAQGRGYATEAARASLNWGARHFGPIRVIAAVSVENRASLRVAEKCGFVECLRTDFGDRTAVFLDRTLQDVAGLR